MTAIDRDQIALAFATIASAAGAAIMEVYATDFESRHKADRSPVTDADTRADAIIAAGLARALPGVPVVSEESFRSPEVETLAGAWILVDPLDGTREFVSRNGEFTVNIALIEAGRPVAGCVFAPALRRIYLGGARALAADLAPGGDPRAAALAAIATRPLPATGVTAVASRSHRDAETNAFLAHLGVAETVSAGSSLKFCRIAEGLADVYPRFGPTMEWDTAAGHAVLAAAGGEVLTPEGGSFVYGKLDRGLRNGAFVAWSAALCPQRGSGGIETAARPC